MSAKLRDPTLHAKLRDLFLPDSFYNVKSASVITPKAPLKVLFATAIFGYSILIVLFITLVTNEVNREIVSFQTVILPAPNSSYESCQALGAWSNTEASTLRDYRPFKSSTGLEVLIDVSSTTAQCFDATAGVCEVWADDYVGASEESCCMATTPNPASDCHHAGSDLSIPDPPRPSPPPPPGIPPPRVLPPPWPPQYPGGYIQTAMPPWPPHAPAPMLPPSPEPPPPTPKHSDINYCGRSELVFMKSKPVCDALAHYPNDATRVSSYPFSRLGKLMHVSSDFDTLSGPGYRCDADCSFHFRAPIHVASTCAAIQPWTSTEGLIYSNPNDPPTRTWRAGHFNWNGFLAEWRPTQHKAGGWTLTTGSHSTVNVITFDSTQPIPSNVSQRSTVLDIPGSEDGIFRLIDGISYAGDDKFFVPPPAHSAFFANLTRKARSTIALSTCSTSSEQSKSYFCSGTIFPQGFSDPGFNSYLNQKLQKRYPDSRVPSSYKGANTKANGDAEATNLRLSRTEFLADCNATINEICSQVDKRASPFACIKKLVARKTFAEALAVSWSNTQLAMGLLFTALAVALAKSVAKVGPTLTTSKASSIPTGPETTDKI